MTLARKWKKNTTARKSKLKSSSAKKYGIRPVLTPVHDRRVPAFHLLNAPILPIKANMMSKNIRNTQEYYASFS